MDTNNNATTTTTTEPTATQQGVDGVQLAALPRGMGWEVMTPRLFREDFRFIWRVRGRQVIERQTHLHLTPLEGLRRRDGRPLLPGSYRLPQVALRFFCVQAESVERRLVRYSRSCQK